MPGHYMKTGVNICYHPWQFLLRLFYLISDLWYSCLFLVSTVSKFHQKGLSATYNEKFSWFKKMHAMYVFKEICSILLSVKILLNGYSLSFSKCDTLIKENIKMKWSYMYMYIISNCTYIIYICSYSNNLRAF